MTRDSPDDLLHTADEHIEPNTDFVNLVAAVHLYAARQITFLPGSQIPLHPSGAAVRELAHKFGGDFDGLCCAFRRSQWPHLAI